MASTVFYLDRRNVRDGLPAPLKVSVCVNAKRFYIATGVKVFPMCWDSRAQVVFNYPDARKIMERLHDFMDSVNETLDRLNVDVLAEKLSANELRAKVEGRLGIGKKARVKDGMAPNGVWAIFNACIELKQGRTRELYELTLRKLRAFAGEEALKRLRFEDINKMWLDRFDAFMAQTAKPNARNIDLRNLRAVFNYAIDNEFTSNYPFRRFKLRYTPTRKRALSVEQLRKVIGAPVPQWCEQYRDMWVLMFMLRGINIVDLCGLKRIDGDGCVTYIRAKTHRLYSIKVEPEARAIIERHRGQSFLLDMLDTHKDYRSYYRQMRRGLKAVLDALNGIDDGVHIDELTTYWSRHSWATIASRIDVPKDVIAAGLGHAQNSVTDIYIDFDDSKVDAANRRVLDYVLYNKM